MGMSEEAISRKKPEKKVEIPVENSESPVNAKPSICCSIDNHEQIINRM